MASFFADVGHEIPTALPPSLLTATPGDPASVLGLIGGSPTAQPAWPAASGTSPAGIRIIVRFLDPPSNGVSAVGYVPRSPWPRAMAFAALGAAEVVQVQPDYRLARDLLADAVDTMVCERKRDHRWVHVRSACTATCSTHSSCLTPTSAGVV
jgi:hypothetical protein